MTPAQPPLNLAVVGAGPVGLALALHAARALPGARVTLYEARALGHDPAGDPRTLALSLGSVQLLQRLDVWREMAPQCEPITQVHVSQQQPVLLGLLDEPEVEIRAIDVGVPQLGAVTRYGALVAPLQAAWLEASQREPERLASRFGTRVSGLKSAGQGVEVDAGIVETHDLVVVAEGGVFLEQARKPVRHDYRQTAWVGEVELETPLHGTAYERFTQHGPAALLPRGATTASLVWCVASDDDPVQPLDEMQRLAVLNTIFPPRVGRLTGLSALKSFPLGLNAERTLVEGRVVRIGNAAQTLHPVAGQGLNLGLRDAFELVRQLGRGGDVAAALRQLEWQRAPDRWSMIATTDFLARSFTWKLPGLSSARGLGLAALQRLGPAKSLLARRMMFGRR